MKSLTPSARQEIRQQIKRVYSTFLERVATGRNMSVEEVDKVAQGRVWSGSDAYNIGLVDSLGGLEEAVAYAAKLAETESYRTRKNAVHAGIHYPVIADGKVIPRLPHNGIAFVVRYFEPLHGKAVA